jgi:hypothetical protein
MRCPSGAPRPTSAAKCGAAALMLGRFQLALAGDPRCENERGCHDSRSANADAPTRVATLSDIAERRRMDAPRPGSYPEGG